MLFILLFLIFLLLSMITYLTITNSRIKLEHTRNMEKLQQLILSLNSNQKQLNEKVMISKEYDSNYQKDIKTIGDEVVELQKVFIDIISNKKYN
jgi:hypothetical protein